MPFREHTRLFIPTLVVSVLLLCLSGLAAWYLHRSQQESSRLLVQNITRVRAAEELMLVGEQLQVSLDQFLLTGDRDYLKPISPLKQDAADWIRRADELAFAAEDRALVEEIRAGYSSFVANLDRLLQGSPVTEEHRTTVDSLNRSFEREIFQPARKYQRYNHDRLVQLTAHNQSLTDRTGVVLLLFGVSGALVGLLGGFTVARAVQLRLLDTQRAMNRSEQLATLGRIAAALCTRAPQSADFHANHRPIRIDRGQPRIARQEGVLDLGGRNRPS